MGEGRGHTHSHGHQHHHDGAASSGVLKAALAINIAIVLLEAIYGGISHSLALLSDAGHNLTDALGIFLAWGASILASRPPTRTRTYGYRRTTILASLLNAILLLLTTGAILLESIRRLAHPSEVNGLTLVWVAAVAIVLNGVAAMLLSTAGQNDINVRGAFMHMMGDAAVSGGVVVAGIVIHYTGLAWLDPIMSMVISCVILASTWGLLRESFNLVSDAVPAHVDQHEIERFLSEHPGVSAIHDLHIWAMSTTHTVLTVHLIMPAKPATDDFLFELSRKLHDQFGIEHATIQVEHGDMSCHLEPEHVI